MNAYSHKNELNNKFKYKTMFEYEEPMAIWIELFEFIYWFKYYETVLREFMITSYDNFHNFLNIAYINNL